MSVRLRSFYANLFDGEKHRIVAPLKAFKRIDHSAKCRGIDWDVEVINAERINGRVMFTCDVWKVN